MAYKISPQKKQKSELDEIFAFDESKKEKKNITDMQDYAFRVPKEKSEEPEDDLYKMEYNDSNFFEELNQDLSGDNIPIQVKDKYNLTVEANGEKHNVSRKNVAEYNRKYALEDGSESRPLTAFRSLGTIHGERNEIDNINKEVNKVFGEIDEHYGSFKTLPSDDW